MVDCCECIPFTSQLENREIIAGILSDLGIDAFLCRKIGENGLDEWISDDSNRELFWSD